MALRLFIQRPSKPLQNKRIPLKIKSFVDPTADGTIIHSDEQFDDAQSSYIYKTIKCCSPSARRIFSFIMEDHISVIFNVFSKHGVKVHLMQNSALNFSVCADVKPTMCDGLIAELSDSFFLYDTTKTSTCLLSDTTKHLTFPKNCKIKRAHPTTQPIYPSVCFTLTEPVIHGDDKPTSFHSTFDSLSSSEESTDCSTSSIPASLILPQPKTLQSRHLQNCPGFGVSSSKETGVPFIAINSAYNLVPPVGTMVPLGSFSFIHMATIGTVNKAPATA